MLVVYPLLSPLLSFIRSFPKLIVVMFSSLLPYRFFNCISDNLRSFFISIWFSLSVFCVSLYRKRFSKVYLLPCLIYFPLFYLHHHSLPSYYSFIQFSVFYLLLPSPLLTPFLVWVIVHFSYSFFFRLNGIFASIRVYSTLQFPPSTFFFSLQFSTSYLLFTSPRFTPFRVWLILKFCYPLFFMLSIYIVLNFFSIFLLPATHVFLFSQFSIFDLFAPSQCTYYHLFIFIIWCPLHFLFPPRYYIHMLPSFPVFLFTPLYLTFSLSIICLSNFCVCSVFLLPQPAFLHRISSHLLPSPHCSLSFVSLLRLCSSSSLSLRFLLPVIICLRLSAVLPEIHKSSRIILSAVCKRSVVLH